MTPNMVIVTIQTNSGQCWGDYELPATLPVSKFRGLLLQALVQHAPHQFNSWQGRELTLSFQGKPIPEGDTLAAHGVWDGSFVTVQPTTTP